MGNPLGVLSSPSGVSGGGSSVPSSAPKASGVSVDVPIDVSTQVKSAAQSSLDSSGSSFSLGGNSASTGDFIVGGSKGISPWLIGGALIIGFILFKHVKI